MIKKITYTLLFLLISISNIYSQNADFSQNKKFQKAQGYSYSDIDMLLDSASLSMDANPEKAFDFIEIALILSIKKKDKTKRAKTFETLALYYEHFKQYDLSAINYEKSAQLYSKKSSKYFNNKLLAAQQFFKSKQYARSISIYQELLKTKIDNRSKLLIYEGLGDNYYAQKNNKLALTNFQLADKLSEELSEIDKNTEIKLKIANILNQNNDKAALEYLQNASVQSNTTANGRLQLQSQNQIAEFYSSKKMYNKEIQSRNAVGQTLEQNSEVLKKQNVNVTEENFKNNTLIAQRLNSQNQPDEALAYIKKNEKLKGL